MKKAVLAVVALLAVFVGVPASAATPGWDHPGYDAEDSYYNPHESSINAATVGSLTRRWSVPLRRFDETCGGPGALLLAAGRVVASDGRGISAYGMIDGKPAWHFDWDDPMDAPTPVLGVSGGTLIAGHGECNSQSDPNGHLVALDLATGKVRWRVDNGVPVVSFTVDKGMVVMSGESPSDELGTFAYRVSDGRLAWQKPGYAASSPSADGRILMTKAHTVSAVDVVTGAVAWTKRTVWVAEAATPSADRFVVSDGTALSVISAKNGALLWTAKGKQTTFVATDGRRVYRSAGFVVEALNIRNGKHLWQRRLGTESIQPIRAGGLVYTGGPILNAANGDIVSLGAAIADAKILVAAGRVFMVNDRMLSIVAS
ncbi:PQQ-binding-like beta-propeller repeat protein [Actinoplanes sp. TBRC 11911]|uniref:outer membrane protein assembly factor BamB family protein n=1 Tax=Actinoplanes sp. TBRC 11911 TaxID=2729386 RepID=UPI00145F0248|nr:PQQ-binding-like beta-propeller repeat protein [Actinoplanes sp. TBRC 11911]NMO53851.1 PQQ-binding-like beta-propeller repeat protein [Actinoplanes sp. TBRC 11911]